jgi:hypothetical protein
MSSRAERGICSFEKQIPRRSAPRNDKKITSWCHPERPGRNLLFRRENEKSRFLPFDFAQGRNDKGCEER